MAAHPNRSRTARAPDRRADLAAIHIAQKALGLSADDAQALKLAVVGVASAGDMSDVQRRRYLAHLSNLQGKTKGSTGAVRPTTNAPRPERERAIDDPADARWSKARALWNALAHAGQVRVNTDAALMGYVQRQTHASHWRFLNSYQINDVIEALKKWARRAGLSPDGDAEVDRASEEARNG